ncbi:type II toxin-antitoxin system RelE/ParE family toxin [Pseudorhizobium marinum]|uniref:type II toxin-antitoxin system RelE/ParE family toxin n=1 Tax=Pseudorhizobium marinum TaxID=1496690 RepID=UPI001F2F93F0|nr:type II toxin-antitoxin system RelE/ParE family toxin [Pseudorhizobium marinum]
MLPIIRTNRADEDLIEIWSYIAIDNKSAADRVLDAIEARWTVSPDTPARELRATISGLAIGISSPVSI